MTDSLNNWSIWMAITLLITRTFNLVFYNHHSNIYKILQNIFLITLYLSRSKPKYKKKTFETFLNKIFQIVGICLWVKLLFVFVSDNIYIDVFCCFLVRAPPKNKPNCGWMDRSQNWSKKCKFYFKNSFYL